MNYLRLLWRRKKEEGQVELRNLFRKFHPESLLSLQFRFSIGGKWFFKYSKSTHLPCFHGVKTRVYTTNNRYNY